MESFFSRYLDALVGAPAPDLTERPLSQGRGRAGYSFGKRYWASLTGSRLPPVIGSAAEVPAKALLLAENPEADADIAVSDAGLSRAGGQADSGRLRRRWRQPYLVLVSITAAVLVAASTAATLMIAGSASGLIFRAGTATSLALLTVGVLAWLWSDLKLSLARRQRVTTIDSIRDFLSSRALAAGNLNREVIDEFMGMLAQDDHMLWSRLLEQELGAHNDVDGSRSAPRPETEADIDTFVITPPLGYIDRRAGAAPAWRRAASIMTVTSLTVAALIGVAFIDSVRPSSSIPSVSSAATPPLPWIYHTTTSVDGSPVLSGTFLYAGDDNGNIYALNARSGKIRWHLATHGQIDSRPSIARDIVYIGNDNGTFYALDSRTGRIRWTRNLSGAVDSSAAISAGIIYVSSGNNFVYALNAHNGEQLWSYDTGNAVVSSPYVHSGVVYVGSESGHVYALNAYTGKVVWSTAVGGPVDSSPVVAGGVVYVGSGDHDLYALETTSGAVKWRHSTGGPVISSPYIYGQLVYVGSNDRKIYAFNAMVGREVWSYQTRGAVHSSPAVYAGVLYVGSDDGNVYAINAMSGEGIWAYQTGGEVRSSPVVANAIVYVGTDNNAILALNAITGSSATVPSLAVRCSISQTDLKPGITVKLTYDISAGSPALVGLGVGLYDRAGVNHYSGLYDRSSFSLMKGNHSYTRLAAIPANLPAGRYELNAEIWPSGRVGASGSNTLAAATCRRFTVR